MQRANSYSKLKMSKHQNSSSDDFEDTSGRRQPVFSSQRFDRPAAGAPSSGSMYTTDELMGKLLNQAPFQMMQHQGSQRHSSASDTIMRELALAEASLNPSDLLKEGLDEWHDRSLSIRLMKRSRSVSASRTQSGRLLNPFRTSASRRSDASGPLQRYPSEGLGPRHRYDYDFGNVDVLAENEDGSPVDIPKEYSKTLTVTPQANLIHLVLLYHQALVKYGFKDEAQKIADHLSRLNAADLEDMAMGLSGVDLLLRDGLLKYLMSIQPYIPSIPSQIVKFKDVGYTGTVELDAGYESIATKLLGTLKGPFKKSPLEKVCLLRDVTGYLMPGTLTLVMGTPGSGTNVLNRVLSGRSKIKGSTTVGSVTYNGRSVDDIKSRRLVSVVGPNDFHYSFLTVRETLEFARECSQYYKTEHYGDELREILGDVLKAGQDPKLETNLSMIGLKRVAERPVGSPMMPSITEAERHRLSVAEMIAGTYAVYMCDQLNKGLDNTVTFDLVTSIRIFTRVRSTTLLASLIQPAQDVFDLFDRVILLDRNQVVYQGPCQDALPYFESLGYYKPRQLSVPEFLEEVTTSDGAQYLQPGHPRLSTEGFVAAYKNSDLYKDICRVVDDPEVVENFWVQGSQPLGVTFAQNRPNKGHGITEPQRTLVSSLNDKGGSLVDVSMNHTLTVHPGDEVAAVGGPMGMLNYLKIGQDSSKEGVPLFDPSQESVRLQLERPLPDESSYNLQFSRDYVQDAWPEFLLLLRRDLKSTWRYKLGLVIRAVQVLVLGFYVAFTFFRVHVNNEQLNMNLVKSVFFVSLLDMTLFNVGQLPGLVEERNVYYKQNGSNFYRPSSYLFAKFVGSLPFAFAEATTWTFIVYFLTNLSIKDGGWHFWVFYIIILLSVLNGAAMVRFMASFAPTLAAANGMMGISTAIFIVFAGFLMPRFVIPKYWIWAFYIDPLQWGITALMINEFTSSTYSTLCKDVNKALLSPCGQPGRENQTAGHAYLATGQFYTGTHWIGIAIAVLTGWITLWTLLTLRALSSIRHVPMIIVTPSAEAKFLRKSESLIVRDMERQGPELSMYVMPVTISWHELSYDILIPSVGRTLPLLSYISGWAEAGEMIGLVGATGTGKTVLLNCLAGHGINPGRIGGQILVNGYPKNQNAFLRIMGYADQLEAYSPYMTVLEAIAFNCELTLGKTTSLDQRQRFVREILDLLELRSVANSLVKSLGQSFLTLSESTRLRIATELARNPSIFFIDAPTKNLDSRSSLHIVQILKKIADSGRIVIVAMQLPSHRLVTCFTAVQILKRGGECVYWGPVGKDGELLRGYFESIPGTPQCPPNTSVATYALDVIGDGVQDRKAMKDYAFEYRVNELALHNHIQLQRLRRGKGTLGPEITDTGFGSTYLTRGRNIFTKLQLYYWRNVAYSWGRIFSSIMTALLLGSIYFNLKTHNTAHMNTKAGAIFIAELLIAISNAQAVIPQVISNRAAYNKEKSTRQYNQFLYTLSWTFGEVPYLAVSTLIYCVIFCSMTNIAFGGVHTFFLYWFILFELSLAITFFGMLLASVSVLPQIAGSAVTIFIGFWVATSGLVVPKKKILPQFVGLFWTNPIQYALGALTTVAFYCDTDQTLCKDHGRNLQCVGSALNPLASNFCPKCPCQRLTDSHAFVWDTIKFNRTLDHDRVRIDIVVLLGFITVFRLATFAVWRYRSRNV